MRHQLPEVIRALLRAPLHTTLIVLMLALAVGATTTIYSVVHGVLLRPLPFPDQDLLYMLWQRAPGVGVAEDWFSPAQYFDLAEQVHGFDELAVFFGSNVTLTGGDSEPERLGALEASSSLFELLRLPPTLGRTLHIEDDTPGGSRKAILGHRLFQRRFGGDAAIVGRSVEIDGEPLEVIGVLPDIELDSDLLPTLHTIPRFDLVLSLPLEDPQKTTYGSENYNILARLAPGANLVQVHAELLAVAERFVQDPDSLGAGLEPGSEYRIGLVPLRDQVVGGVELPLLVLLGATGLFLLIACANVANLLMIRAAGQRRELALRAALGAHPARLVAQSLLGAGLLAATGGLAGIGLAVLGVRALTLAAPPELPRLGEIEIDLAVLLFAAGLCLISSLLFGVAPSLRRSSVLPQEALRDGAPASKTRALWRGGSRLLVIAQVALSLVLAVGGVLLTRTWLELGAVDPGFRSEGVLTFRLSLVGERYRTQGERSRLFEQFFGCVRELGGVTAAGGVSMLPLTRGYAWTDFWIEGYDVTDDRDRVVADVHLVTPGYFEAMGIPLLAGRTFVETDEGEPPVVMVNRHFAERFWALGDAVGRWVGRSPEERAIIVGVIDSVRHYGLDAEPRLAVFYPYRQFGRATLYGVAHTTDAPSALASPIAETLHRLDPDLPVYDVLSMTERFDISLKRQRVLMSLICLLAGIALLLAAIGLYGLLAFTVATHAREIGIRKAVGARRRDIVRHVVGGAAALVLIGSFIGISVSLLASRWLAGLVYGIAPVDLVSYGTAVALVLAVSLLASLLPARRAAAVDPIVALRSE